MTTASTTSDPKTPTDEADVPAIGAGTGVGTGVVAFEGGPAAAASMEIAPASTGAVAPLILTPVASPETIIAAQNATRAFVAAALVEGRDFGIIPGTDRKTMLKPGAERTALGFGCTYGEPVIIEREVDHDRRVEWSKSKNGEVYDSGVSFGLYRYVVKVPVIHAATGRVVGIGVGSCSTMESRYVDRPRDLENTVLKMAHKRAVVAGCLLAFGLSDEFTQDVEDMDLPAGGRRVTADVARQREHAARVANEPEARCPKCNGKMWDNRLRKTNPKAPDFKCRDRSCDGVYWPGQWPPKSDEEKATAAAKKSTGRKRAAGDTAATPDARARERTTERGRERLGDRHSDFADPAAGSEHGDDGLASVTFPIAGREHTGALLVDIPTDALEGYADECRVVLERRHHEGKPGGAVEKLLDDINRVLDMRVFDANDDRAATATGENEEDDDLPF